jgi:hypothetical protein
MNVASLMVSSIEDSCPKNQRCHSGEWAFSGALACDTKSACMHSYSVFQGRSSSRRSRKEDPQFVM